MNSSIASWPETTDIDVSLPAIASETSQTSDAKWDACMDALLKYWKTAPTQSTSEPDRRAVESALRQIMQFRRTSPNLTPICVIPEAGGEGLVVEHYVSEGVTLEFTHFNRGEVELTIYKNGLVAFMDKIATI